MKLEISLKQEQIVEAAVKRFSHFGISKTTLSEIAEDMGITKQALFYYFHDKQSLIDAVQGRLQFEYLELLRTQVKTAGNVEEAVMELTRVKGVFFEKYFMIASDAEHMASLKQESYVAWRHKLANEELQLMTEIIEEGVRSGELKPANARKTTELLLYTLYAFSRCVKDKSLFPDKAAFTEILNKQQAVIKLFFQGLKSETRQPAC